MVNVLVTIWLFFLAMALLAEAQGEPQSCTFFLNADGSHLTQIDGGQVVGLQGTDTALGPEGILFRLEKGGLYDGMSRGCWWASKLHPSRSLFPLDACLQFRPVQHTNTSRAVIASS